MTATLLGTDLPIVAAPMAGGPTTTALAAATTQAGAFAFLAGGNKSLDALADEIAIASAWGAPFGVNLFAPGTRQVDGGAFARYAQALTPEAEAHGITLDATPHTDDDDWADKFALLRENPVPVVSFTFALPTPQDIASLRRAGSIVLSSVTTAEEASAATDAGVDGLVVQGPAAGGHSATWNPNRELPNEASAHVVSSIRAITDLPIIAAGGIDGPDAARDLLARGAESVAIGTLLLRTNESGASAIHKNALTDPVFTETAITRTFTGRPARALRNGFMNRHESEAITAYPAVHHLTRELRRRAAATGDTDRLHMWAGAGYRAAAAGPAADVIARLAAEL